MGYEYSTLTSDSTGLKKRSTRSTAIVRGRVAAWSRKTAMSRRTKKHRNANINLEKING